MVTKGNLRNIITALWQIQFINCECKFLHQIENKISDSVNIDLLEKRIITATFFLEEKYNTELCYIINVFYIIDSGYEGYKLKC